MSYCPDCKGTLKILDWAKEPEGNTHECKKCGQRYMIIWGYSPKKDV